MGLNLKSLAEGFLNPVSNFINPIFGAGSGGLLGNVASNFLGDLNLGNRPAGTTTSVQDIPEWQKGYIFPALQTAQGMFHGSPISQPLLKPGEAEYAKTMSGGYLNSNPYLDQTFGQAARGVADVYKNTVQPRTDSMFFGPGSLGGNSAYQGQVARNNYGFGQNLTDLATNIYGGNYQQERNRQFSATMGAPAYTSATGQAQMSPFNAYMDVVGRPFGSTSTDPYFKNDLGGLLGLGSLALGAFSMSDRRLKSDIVRVGTHPLGIGIYEYEIDGRRERGVMADEVEKVRPGAVVEIGGFKSVNYAAL